MMLDEGRKVQRRYPDIQLWDTNIDAQMMWLTKNPEDYGVIVAGNMFGDEAARLAKEIHARVAIPCHYDMFTFNTADPAEFVAVAERTGQAYTVLRGGERFSGMEKTN